VTFSARRALVLAASLAMLAAVPATPSLALSSTACRVRNLDSGVTKRSLQGAVTAADAGQRLTVRGQCHGLTTIDKDLTITGIRPKGAARPALDGNGLGTTVITVEGTTVTIRSLRITGGDGYGTSAPPFNNGGGVVNSGPLTLKNVVVSGNHASCGGGISAQAPLVLSGATKIRGNTSDGCGGGIDVDGSFRPTSLLMKERASVSGNHTDGHGGGVNVYGNAEAASLTMAGSSSIHDNDAGDLASGGGVNNQGGTLSGVTCTGTGRRVHDNTPANCINEV
jgi:nitrous oxidase accessory protein NosD